jgi:ubiquinone/menaquinone biosynthesis C-methylase UbiE
MLDRALKKVEANSWRNVQLLRLDAHRLALNCVEAAFSRSIEVDSIICTLGFSVFADWQAVFERSFGLLKKGGRYCIMDIFNDTVTLRTRAVRILASADNSRKVWEPLKNICPDYAEERYPMPHGDTVVVACGTKP